jgi:tetratricopeptide (TPR) repeat protein
MNLQEYSLQRKRILNIFYAMSFDNNTKFHFSKELEETIEIRENQATAINFSRDCNSEKKHSINKIYGKNLTNINLDFLVEIPKIKTNVLVEYLENDFDSEGFIKSNFRLFFIDRNAEKNIGKEYDNRYFTSNELEEVIYEFSSLPLIKSFSDSFIIEVKFNIGFDFWKKLKLPFNHMSDFELSDKLKSANVLLKLEQYSLLNRDLYLVLKQMMNEAIQLNNCNWEFYLIRSKALYYLKEYDKALIDCNLSIIWNPNNSDAFYERGQQFTNLKYFDLAESDFRRAVELNPESFLAHFMLGLVLLKSENSISEAVNAFKNSNYLNQNDICTQFYLGVSLAKNGNIEDAIEIFNDIISSEPTLAKAYINRGICDYKNGNLKSAIDFFSKAIKLDSASAIAYFNRGYCKEKLKINNDIISDLETANLIDNKFFEMGIPINKFNYKLEPMLVWFD